jgi:hypothetical protein
MWNGTKQISTSQPILSCEEGGRREEGERVERESEGGTGGNSVKSRWREGKECIF